MSHLVINSVPRSGQVFLSNVCQYAFQFQISTAHLPEIFGVKDLYHVSVFRKPEEAIASLLNKHREHFVFQDISGKLDIDNAVETSISTYDKYIDAVSNNLGNVHVVLFEDIKLDYRPVIQSISDKFSIKIKNGYENRFSLDESSPIWADKYDGHLPRERDALRLRIEEQVSSMDSILRLTERYHTFLAKI
jgi:hypothetical protein